MKDPVVRIKLRVRFPDGSRRFLNPVKSENGRLKPLRAFVDGKPVHFPTGIYHLRYDKRWEKVGSDPQMAETAQLQRKLELASGKPVAKEPPKTSDIPVVQTAVDAYLTRIRLHRPPKTIAVYTRILNLFAKSCGKIRLDQLKDTDLIKHLAMLREKKRMAPRTVSNHYNRINTMLRVNRVTDLLQREDRPKYDEKSPDAYSQEQLRAIFAAANAEDRLLFEFFVGTGFREQEVMFCTWRDVNSKDGLITVRSKPEMGFRIKDCEERTVPIPDSLVASLIERKKHSTTHLLFPGPDGKPNGHFLRIIKKIAFEAELNCGECLNRSGQSCAKHPVCASFTLHKFRRTYATLQHEVGGVSVRMLQSLLGHASLDTTLRYLAVSERRSPQMRAKVNLAFAGLSPDSLTQQEIAQNYIRDKSAGGGR